MATKLNRAPWMFVGEQGLALLPDGAIVATSEDSMVQLWSAPSQRACKHQEG
jgi:hypothetical protein